MAQIPAGSKLVFIDPLVPTKELKSTRSNSKTEVYTIEDITDTVINSVPAELIIAASDETTPLTAGTDKVTFRMPYAMTLTEVRASLSVAGSVSDETAIDIFESGVSILSTKITIDHGDKTSKVASTPAVISDFNLADDAEMSVDILGLTGGADEAGLKITLIGYRA
jgi:hypothetical protein